MGLKIKDEDKTRLDSAVESCSHMIRQKLLFNPNDYIGIIINGCNESDNQDNIKNVLVFREVCKPELSILKDIYRLKPTDCKNGDILQSIKVALNSFNEIHGDRKWNKRIFLLTDGETPIDSTNLEKISDMINNFNVKVNIIAINFFEEIEEEFSDNFQETDNQKETKNVLKKLIKMSPNVKVFTSNMANSIHKQFRKKRISPYVKYRGPLYFTENLFFDVNVFSKTVKSDIPSLKSFSLAAEYNDDSKKNLTTIEKIYYVNDDPDCKPLDKENVAKAYYYGKGLVPIPETDQVLFKNEEARNFKVIGFTDNFRIPRHHFIGGSEIVVPSPGNENDKRAITVLVEEMQKTNKVMICRFVSKANSDPKLVVLIPSFTSNGAVFYVNNLATREDIRQYEFPSLNECTVKQEEVVSKFIDTLDLDLEEEDNEEEKLKPNNIHNPTLQYFYQCLEHRALNDQNNLPPLDETIEDYMKPDKTLFENNKYVTFLPKVFDIKQKQNEEKKKKVFWRDIIKQEMTEDLEEINKKRIQEKLENNKHEAKTTISFSSPIDDFKEMINFKYEDLTLDALEQMKKIIIKFILESFKGSYYIRALDCLKVMRESSIDEDEVDFFNNFLEVLKKDFPKEKFMDFWKLLIDNKITLISIQENINSKYPEEETIAWLNLIDRKEIITSTLNDLDKLIDDIE